MGDPGVPPPGVFGPGVGPSPGSGTGPGAGRPAFVPMPPGPVGFLYFISCLLVV